MARDKVPRGTTAVKRRCSKLWNPLVNELIYLKRHCLVLLKMFYTHYSEQNNDDDDDDT